MPINIANNFTWRFYLTESSIEIECAFLWSIWIRINGAPWCIKGTDESSLVTDSLFPLMNHVSDPGSLIMIQITPKEHTVSVIIIDFRNSKQKHTSKTTEFNVQRSL